MNEQIKAEWISLLRYGGLKQNTGGLYNRENGSFCCLGVLCELARAYDVVDLDEFESYVSKTDETKGSSCFLPSAVQKWSGINTCYPSLRKDRKPLTILNDVENKNFSEIADLIESDDI